MSDQRLPTPQKRGAKKVAAAAILALMAYEAFRSVPYKDIGGVWTDGYGNTDGVVPGKAVTEPEARAKMMEHVDKFTLQVVNCFAPFELTQGQLNAFVSMGYNTGTGAKGRADGLCWLKNGYHSTIVRRYKAGDEGGSCLGMLSWTNVGGKFSRGVYNRRWHEYNDCIAGTYKWNTEGRR